MIELLLKYDEKMRFAEAKYFRSEEAELAEEEGVDVELVAFHAKLKGGGDLFHRIAATLAFVAVGSKRCHAHILEQLQLNKSGISGKFLMQHLFESRGLFYSLSNRHLNYFLASM